MWYEYFAALFLPRSSYDGQGYQVGGAGGTPHIELSFPLKKILSPSLSNNWSPPIFTKKWRTSPAFYNLYIYN